MTSNWSAFLSLTADNSEALDSCRPSRRPQKHSYWTWVKTFSLISCGFFLTDPALCQESMTSLERHQLQIISADISSTSQQQLVVFPFQFPAFYSPKQGHWSRARGSLRGRHGNPLPSISHRVRSDVFDLELERLPHKALYECLEGNKSFYPGPLRIVSDVHVKWLKTIWFELTGKCT
jgi:hypothetical protein